VFCLVCADIDRHVWVRRKNVEVLCVHLTTTATHRAGHCLAVHTSRTVCPFCWRRSTTFSDHSTIGAQVDLQVPQDHTTERRVQRCWCQFDLDRFIEDLKQSSLVRDSTDDHNVNDLFDRSLLDVHAPTRMVRVRAARSAPWYDADCRETKKQTCRLEKLYRTSKAAGDRLQWTARHVYQRQFFQRKLTITGSYP